MTGNIQSRRCHGLVGSQTWADGQTKTNVAQKNIHTLFFLVVGDFLSNDIIILSNFGEIKEVLGGGE